MIKNNFSYKTISGSEIVISETRILRKNSTYFIGNLSFKFF